MINGVVLSRMMVYLSIRLVSIVIIIFSIYSEKIVSVSFCSKKVVANIAKIVRRAS